MIAELRVHETFYFSRFRPRGKLHDRSPDTGSTIIFTTISGLQILIYEETINYTLKESVTVTSDVITNMLHISL